MYHITCSLTFDALFFLSTGTYFIISVRFILRNIMTKNGYSSEFLVSCCGTHKQIPYHIIYGASLLNAINPENRRINIINVNAGLRFEKHYKTIRSMSLPRMRIIFFQFMLFKYSLKDVSYGSLQARALLAHFSASFRPGRSSSLT